MTELEFFEVHWERCYPWIEAALDLAHGTHTMDDVRRDILTGPATFWPGRNAAMVTEVQEFPQMHVLHFWLAGGDLDELRDELRPMAEKWAKERGITRATIMGRRGWVRALPGYQEVSTVCAKEL